MADSSFTGGPSPQNFHSPSGPLPTNYDFTYSYPPPQTRTLPPLHRDSSEFSDNFPGSTPAFTPHHSSDLHHGTTTSPPPGSRSESPLQRTPSRSEPSGSGDVLPPIFVDQVAKLFTLSATHVDILCTFVQVGSVAPALSQPDLATRLYILAAILSSSSPATRTTTTSATRAVTVDEITAIMADLRIQLEDAFHLTKEQMENSRAVAQDLIYEPMRTNYKSLWTDVQKCLAKDQVLLRMSNVFGSPHREKVLVALIKRQTSSVRNAFRQEIRDSIGNGKGRRSLVDFTWQTAMKYRRSGAADVDISFTIKNALLRRFAIDHPELLNISENENTTDGDPELTHVDADSGPANKKRKQNARGGRIPNGECFWIRFEGYIAPLIEKMGSNMASPAWKTFSEDIIARDRRSFLHAGDRLQTMPATEPFANTLDSAQPFHTASPSRNMSTPSYRDSAPAMQAGASQLGWPGFSLAGLLNA